MSAFFVPSPVDGTRLFVEHQPRPGNLCAILCDGIACDGFIWKYLRQDIADLGLGTAHWHYRGHGRSSAPVDPTKIALVDLAADARGVHAAVGAPKTVLFGHSMGCQVALEAYRALAPDVAALVLVCGSFGRITYSFKGTQLLAQWLPTAIAKVEAHPLLTRAVWGRMPTELALRVALATGEVDRRIRPEDLLPYMKHMVDIDVLMFLKMLQSAGEHTAEDLLPQIQVPVLVVAGGRDSFTPPSLAEKLAKLLPRGELWMVPEGTHATPIERPTEMRERLNKFFSDHGLAGSAPP